MTRERKSPEDIRKRRPKIIIAGITNVQDALDCLNLGVDGISYIFFDDPRKIAIETAAEISKNLPPFFHIIGEFPEMQVDKVKRYQRECRLTALRFSGSENHQYFSRLNIKIVKKINITPEWSPKTLKRIPGIFYEYKLTYKVKNSNEKKLLIDKAKLICESDEYAILSGDIYPESVSKLALYNPYAIRIKSGAELFIGKKDKRKISKILKGVQNENI